MSDLQFQKELKKKNSLIQPKPNRIKLPPRPYNLNLKNKSRKIIPKKTEYLKSCKSGVLRVKATKGNIFLTLRAKKTGVIKAITTAGAQGLKGKKRRAAYVLKNCVALLGKKAFALKLNPLDIEYEGNAYRKKRLSIFRTLKQLRFEENRRIKLYFKNLTKIIRHSHNGCRPSKKRRK